MVQPCPASPSPRSTSFVFLGLGAAGFIVVALVCAGVLALLQLILPSADAGAEAADRLHPPEETAPQTGSAPG